MKKYKFTAAVVLAGAFFFQCIGWAGEYTDKSYHSDEGHFYKHPSNGSFTGPFDYGAKIEPLPPKSVPTGKCNCFSFGYEF